MARPGGRAPHKLLCAPPPQPQKTQLPYVLRSDKIEETKERENRNGKQQTQRPGKARDRPRKNRAEAGGDGLGTGPVGDVGGYKERQQTSSSGSRSAGNQPQGNVNWAQVLGGLGGGSVSSGWQSQPNTGRLDTSVSPDARAKYTKLLDGGRDTVTIMVYTGGCKAWQNTAVSSSVNQIWQIKDGKMLCLEKDLGSVPMTDPNTLSCYIKWCAKHYPASRYELILWDHGGGSVSGYGYDEKFASSGSMSLAGLDKALTDGGVKFDFIGFDACLMATAETALTMSQHADYLIASEETEPGVGWYYTDWLTALGKDPSMPTIQLGQKIVDSFVDTCAQKCRGQATTPSVIDLAELEMTLPDALADFSKSTAKLIQGKQYQTVSDARSGTREFARSSQIDQVDLVHLAQNLGTAEGKALSKVLLSAVKYNRTSDNMTNAYGLSIYFPYRKTSTVDRAVSTYQQIGMDESYSRCIRQFASLAASGQASYGGTSSPLTSLLGAASNSSGGEDMVSLLLGEFLGGGFGRVSGLTSDNTDFLSDRAMSEEDTLPTLPANLVSSLVYCLLSLPSLQYTMSIPLQLHFVNTFFTHSITLAPVRRTGPQITGFTLFHSQLFQDDVIYIFRICYRKRFYNSLIYVFVIPYFCQQPAHPVLNLPVRTNFNAVLKPEPVSRIFSGRKITKISLQLRV